MLRQLIISRSPTEIPQDIVDLWNNRRLSGKHILSEEDARQLLDDELSLHPKKYLVIDAIDEAEGCKLSIDNEIQELRHKGMCILSTDRRDPLEHSNRVYCYRCGDGPKWLYWECDQCIGYFQEKVKLCQDCYIVKGLRCLDANHKMEPPRKVNVQARASQSEMERYVAQFRDDEFNGGDTGDDDETMFGGQMTMLSALRQELESDFWDSLPAKVTSAAGGNFLYAKVFLDRLRIQPSLKGALSLVQQLDYGMLDDLEGQYDSMLSLCINTSNKVGSKVAYDHLVIVTSAFEVLTFAQLAHATAITHGDRLLGDFTGRCCRKQDVRRYTNGLLTVQDSGEAESFPVAFFHRSLSTYIERNQQKWFPDADQRIFEACLAYLGLEKFCKPFESLTQLDSAMKEYPFASYAARYWGLHAKAVPSSVKNSLLILELLNDANRLSCVMQIAWYTRSWADSNWDVSAGITPLHACAFYGFETLCRALLLFVSPTDLGDDTYNQTPLIYASRRGYVEIVELLLKAGANVNHLSMLERTPLLEAIENDHNSVFNALLIRKDTNLNLQGSGRDARTALIKAAELGRLTQLNRLLKDPRIDVNKPDNWNCTALARAVQSLNVDCISSLLKDDRTDLAVEDSSDHRKALDWTVDDLLDYDSYSDEIDTIANVLISDRRKPKASNRSVTLAIQESKPQLLTIFVHAGLDHSYADEHGRNFLHLAAIKGDYVIIKHIYDDLVVRPSFSINRLDNYKASALHAACMNLSDAHGQTIAFLLEMGADPLLKDQLGFTPIKRAESASSDLWASQIKALFEPYVKSTDFDSVDTSKPTVENFMRLADVDALEAMIKRSDDPLDPETDQYTLSTILHRAIKMPDEFSTDFLRLLLPRSKNFINATDSSGRTCVHFAVLQHSSPNLELLMNAGADLNIKDHWHQTAFQLAQAWQRYDMCVVLVKAGVQLPAAKELRPEMLYAAVEFGELKAVSGFVEAGVDIFYRDSVTRATALQRAKELFEAAAQEENDRLINEKKMDAWVNIETFRKAKYGALEVVKREEIVKYLREVQKRAIKTQDLRRRPTEDLSKLIEKMKTLDQEKILEISDLEEKEERSGSSGSLPSYEDATRNGHGRVPGKAPVRRPGGVRTPSVSPVNESSSSERSTTITIKIDNQAGIAIAVMVGFFAIVWLLLKTMTSISS